ncbi:hypothetical protein P4T70_22400 [Bacillus mobilis]|uniref:hypothetical protein n=1 Tax=Bacillus mobilis TaxID=2026190 RepID=UPI002E20A166|nr:hypothetical protein [Bacillus mobilis]
MKKRILIPVMSMGFLIFGAFYSPNQNTVSAQINNEKSFVDESEFWLYNGDAISYYSYFNTFIILAKKTPSSRNAK